MHGPYAPTSNFGGPSLSPLKPLPMVVTYITKAKGCFEFFLIQQLNFTSTVIFCKVSFSLALIKVNLHVISVCLVTTI